MDNRIRFTKTAIAALTLPESGKRATYYDTTVQKLALRVTSAGTKTFYVIKRAGSEMVWFRLGTFPDMTVEQAQKAADVTLGAFAREENPAAIRRATKKMPTLAEFFKEYGERHGGKNRTWRDQQQRYRDYLEKPLGGKNLDAVTREMVSRVLSDMDRQGRAGATVNLVRALVSVIYAKAIKWGYVASGFDNPVKGIKTRKPVKRDRFLQADELTRFFAAVADEPNDTIRDYLLLSLLTGARRANVQEMQWEELDFNEGIWRIERTKNDDPQNVTLAPEAVEILTARKERIKAPYVFPGNGGSGHLVEPKSGWARVLERAGITNLRIHDLRRTFGSWQAKQGASMAIIGKSLNHKSQQTTAIYARLDLDPVRTSVNLATAAMMEAGGANNTADLLPINSKTVGR